jgi:DNA-binding HxlR family transcriptional regulator
MSNKTYGQLCPIARAMDVLGDRWTLLVIRELLLGPKRFKELLAVLPAMGTNRLSERLAMLSDTGVIRSTMLPLPASVPAYELTADGEQLRQPVIALGLWGLKLPLDSRIDPSSARAELIALCLTGTADPSATDGVHEIIEFRVGTEHFHISIDGSRVLARSGLPERQADVQVECDVNTFMSLALREITPSAAVRDGHVHLHRGGVRAFGRVFKLLEYRP